MTGATYKSSNKYKTADKCMFTLYVEMQTRKAVVRCNMILLEVGQVGKVNLFKKAVGNQA